MFICCHCAAALSHSLSLSLSLCLSHTHTLTHSLTGVGSLSLPQGPPSLPPGLSPARDEEEDCPQLELCSDEHKAGHSTSQSSQTQRE